jgi:hypothetical protein
MVIADESYDGEGRMEDICYLRKRLAERRLYLQVPDLNRLDEVCADGWKSSSFLRYNLWKWPLKYLRGCITTSRDDRSCTNPHEEYFARVLVFKPAIDISSLAPYLLRCPRHEIGHGTSRECRDAFEALRVVEPHFPSELFGFLVRYPPTGSDPAPGQFPQDTTKAMTLHSSPVLYGAYRELARWQMHGIADEIDGRSKKLHVPIEPVHAH